MNKNITKILIASNVMLLAGFLWLWQQFSGEGLRPPSENLSSELKTDPKTGESLYHKEQVKNTIIKHSGDLQKCYQAFLTTKPKVDSGALKIDWQILPSGKAEKVQRVLNRLGSDNGAQNLENCVIENIQTWEFPPPPIDRPVYVAHNFFFGERQSGPPEMVNVK